MDFLDSSPNGAARCRSLFHLGVAVIAGLLSSCQYNPFESTQTGAGQAGAPFASNQARGRRILPSGAATQPAMPPSYYGTETAAAWQQAVPTSNAATPPNRWDTGRTWSQRAEGAQANWRGSGVGWQRGGRTTPGHYSQEQRSAPPSTPASTWQEAPYYPSTQASSPPSYGSRHGSYNPHDPAAASHYGTASGTQYVIRKGDTLSGIARQHQVSLDALLRANGMTRDQVIFPGQSLIVPGR